MLFSWKFGWLVGTFCIYNGFLSSKKIQFYCISLPKYKPFKTLPISLLVFMLECLNKIWNIYSVKAFLNTILFWYPRLYCSPFHSDYWHCNQIANHKVFRINQGLYTYQEDKEDRSGHWEWQILANWKRGKFDGKGFFARGHS